MLLSKKNLPENIENALFKAIACNCIVTCSYCDLIFKLDELDWLTTAKHQSYHEHAKCE